jgi:hypothetical protein
MGRTDGRQFKAILHPKIGCRGIVRFWKLSSKKACFAPQVFNQSTQKNHPKVVFCFLLICFDYMCRTKTRQMVCGLGGARCRVRICTQTSFQRRPAPIGDGFYMPMSPMPPMPPMPPPIPPPAGSSFGNSATMQSVVNINDATDAAFCNAVRVTLVGSRTPISTISP